MVGVDIGGTHITAALVDIGSGKILEDSFVRRQVDPSGSAGEIIEAWTSAITACNQPVPLDTLRVGISMPGPFDYQKGISLITGLHKFESLHGLNVKNLLAESLGTPASNIHMENDAICYLAGERMAGAGKGVDYLAGITLGTGLGSAIYANQRYVMGDLYCMPFRDSRAEEYLCSRWFTATYKRHIGKTCSGVKELALLAADEPIALELFRQFGQTLAEVLILKFGDDFPSMIILGGNIANAWELFYRYCEQALTNYNTSLSRALLGENAALIGAVGSFE